MRWRRYGGKQVEGTLVILVDIFEPDLIFNLLHQSVEVTRQNLVQLGLPDYVWAAVDGHRIGVERKQWGEVLSSPNNVEEQLRREMVSTEETVLLVEGVASATPHGMDVYTKADNKPYYRLQHSYGTPKHPQAGLYHRIQSWFWVLDKCGIAVYRTCNSRDTASALVAWYKAGQKEEHATLRRYIRSRISLKVHDPRVLSLMGIKGVELGEVRATALVERFGSVWAVVNAGLGELVEVDGIGTGLARRLIEAVGRPYLD